MFHQKRERAIITPVFTDAQARLGKKRTTQWIGYKVHITETCDHGLPHLITHVETSSAPVADGVQTPMIHRSLENKQLLPQIHLADTGYVDATLLAASWDDYQVDLLGPTRSNQRWQARADTGFATEHFALDWHNQRATCPAGSQSLSWTPSAQANGQEVIWTGSDQDQVLTKGLSDMSTPREMYARSPAHVDRSAPRSPSGFGTRSTARKNVAVQVRLPPTGRD